VRFLNRRKKLGRIWFKIFGLRVGTKVKVIDVFERDGGGLKGKKFLEREGIITKIKEGYYSDEERVFYISCLGKRRLMKKLFFVRFKDGEEWYFTGEDLEVIG